MTAALRDGGSFRDPSGHIYDVNGEILRTVTRKAAADYDFVRSTGLTSIFIDAENGMRSGVPDGNAARHICPRSPKKTALPSRASAMRAEKS